MPTSSKFKAAAIKYSDDQYYDLFILLDTTRNATKKAREKELEKYGLSTRQSAVLYFSHKNSGKITPVQLARWLVLEPHSVSELVNRMEKQGFVKKVRHGSHIYKIVLTKKGQEAYRNASRRESIHKVMSCLSDEEQKQLRAILLKLKLRAFDEFD